MIFFLFFFLRSNHLPVKMSLGNGHGQPYFLDHFDGDGMLKLFNGSQMMRSLPLTLLHGKHLF